MVIFLILQLVAFKQVSCLLIVPLLFSYHSGGSGLFLAKRIKQGNMRNADTRGVSRTAKLQAETASMQGRQRGMYTFFLEKKKASFVLAKLHILKDIDQKIITIKNWNEQNN